MRHVELDVHTHTVASGHAYGTINEMCREASNRGLKIYGITEHTGGIPGTCNDIYFQNIKVVPRFLFGVEILLGAEINIVDYDGSLDLNRNKFKYLDVRIAGIHAVCYNIGNKSDNTAAYIGAIKNKEIDIISHPDTDVIPADIEALCEAAKVYHTLLEVNNNSLRLPSRKNVPQNILKILKYCKKLRHPVILGSDAHFMNDIANYDNLIPLLKEADFPGELIINYDAEKFRKFLRMNHEPGIKQ